MPLDPRFALGWLLWCLLVVVCGTAIALSSPSPFWRRLRAPLLWLLAAFAVATAVLLLNLNRLRP